MCDECGRMFPWVFVEKSPEEIAEGMAEAGWVRTSEEDLCPDHLS